TATAGCCSVDTDCHGGNPCALPKCDSSANLCVNLMASNCCQSDSDCTGTLECAVPACDTLHMKCEFHPAFPCGDAGTHGSTTGGTGKSGCGCTVGETPPAELAFLLLVGLLWIARQLLRKTQ